MRSGTTTLPRSPGRKTAMQTIITSNELRRLVMSVMLLASLLPTMGYGLLPVTGAPVV